jgi:hypothetical protein
MFIEKKLTRAEKKRNKLIEKKKNNELTRAGKKTKTDELTRAGTKTKTHRIRLEATLKAYSKDQNGSLDLSHLKDPKKHDPNFVERAKSVASFFGEKKAR